MCGWVCVCVCACVRPRGRLSFFFLSFFSLFLILFTLDCVFNILLKKWNPSTSFSLTFLSVINESIWCANFFFFTCQWLMREKCVISNSQENSQKKKKRTRRKASPESANSTAFFPPIADYAALSPSSAKPFNCLYYRIYIYTYSKIWKSSKKSLSLVFMCYKFEITL